MVFLRLTVVFFILMFSVNLSAEEGIWIDQTKAHDVEGVFTGEHYRVSFFDKEPNGFSYHLNEDAYRQITQMIQAFSEEEQEGMSVLFPRKALVDFAIDEATGTGLVFRASKLGESQEEVLEMISRLILKAKEESKEEMKIEASAIEENVEGHNEMVVHFTQMLETERENISVKVVVTEKNLFTLLFYRTGEEEAAKQKAMEFFSSFELAKTGKSEPAALKKESDDGGYSGGWSDHGGGGGW